MRNLLKSVYMYSICCCYFANNITIHRFVTRTQKEARKTDQFSLKVPKRSVEVTCVQSEARLQGPLQDDCEQYA